MGSFIPKGFRTLTGYPVVRDAAGLIEFLKETFGAGEAFRTIGGAGGIHCEMRFGDSMLMLGGGGEASTWAGEPRPMAFHLSVPDVDITYQRALAHGAVSLQEPDDQFWNERTANIRDPFGNHWYIGTHKGDTWYFEGLPVLQPYLHPVHAEPVIDFLTRAFGAQELGRHTSREGKILHSTLQIGDGSLEMSEADGPYQPMPGMFYLYVPDVDASYRLAVEAGGTAMSAPVDQSYGDRSARVDDPFGNQWYMATHFAQAANS
jgi:PhnB protein